MSQIRRIYIFAVYTCIYVHILFGGPGLNSRPTGRPGTAGRRRVRIQNKLRSKMLPATAKKLVMVHMCLKMETMKESGKWEADLLEHTDEDQTWEQLTSLDEDED